MNIYISGLNFSTTDADLNDLFSEYGEVSSARIITDRETRRSRGFGFVEIEGQDEDIFIPESDTGTAMHQDKVRIIIRNDKKEGKRTPPRRKTFQWRQSRQKRRLQL